MVSTLLYEMQPPCNCFTLSLSGSERRISNGWRSGRDTMMEIKGTSRGRSRSGRYVNGGDHDGALEMEIKTQDDDDHTISLTLIACDVYPLCILFFLVRR